MIIAVLLSLCSLASCVAKPEEEGSGDIGGGEIETFTPAIDVGGDSGLLEKYSSCQENLSLAFSGYDALPAESFEYEIGESGVTIVEYIGSNSVVVVPSEIESCPVTKIASGAFSGKAVRAVSVPTSVREIEKGALADCDGLATVRLPFVGDGKDNCHFGYVFGADDYMDNPVALPNSLSTVIIDGDVKIIEDNAFAGCHSIAALAISNSVERIGDFAFFECYGLVCVELGAKDKSVGKYAFAYCDELFHISLESAIEINVGALQACNSLYSVKLPFVGKNATENRFIGHIFGAESADYNDEFIPKTLRKIELGAKCSSIPDRAFAACDRITSVTMPDSIEMIGVRAFYACRSIRDIIVPDSVRVVGDDAFFGCDSLESVSLGVGLESIGMQAFYGCSTLKTVEIPALITEIKASTFYGCSSLEDIDLANVTTVRKDAFGKCSALTPPNTGKILVSEEGNDALYKSEMDTTEPQK